jgi:signal transduction histidine kinase
MNKNKKGHSALGAEADDIKVFVPRRIVRRAQFLHLLQFIPIMSIMNIVVAIVVLGVLHPHANPLYASLWISVIIGLSLFSLWKAYQINRHFNPEAIQGRSLRASLIFTIMMGLSWGSAELVFGFADNENVHIFIAFIAIGLTAGVVTSLSPLPRHCLAFSLTAMPLSVLWMLYHGSREGFAMGLLLIVFVRVLAYIAFRSFHAFMEALRDKQALQMAHMRIRDAIENTGEAFAIFSAEGELQLANRMFRDFFPDGNAGNAGADLEPGHQLVQSLAGGRWVQSTLRRTSSGELVSVHADITHLKQQEQELIEARKQAESANQAKSQFLSVMSHELRTPLNSIIGFAELIARDDIPMPAKTVRDYSVHIKESGRHLLELISGILDLSRIEAGRYDLQEESIDLEELTRSVLNHVAPMAAKTGISLKLDCKMDLPMLRAEQRALRQILLNLLSNAIKFTPPDGAVKLCVDMPEKAIRIRVIDSGIGIAAEDQEKIFEPFQQVDNSLSRQFPGTGLGLPLVKNLATLHQATVTVRSAPGKGTEFTVQFPENRTLMADQAAYLQSFS